MLFAKILSNINPRNFLKSKKEVKALSEEVFNKELKAKIQESIAKQEVEHKVSLKILRSLKVFLMKCNKVVIECKDLSRHHIKIYTLISSMPTIILDTIPTTRTETI